MSENKITESAIDNLQQIKRGNDPRTSNDTSPETDDALEFAKQEVYRLYEEHYELREQIIRDWIHVGVSRNDGRNGVWKANTRLTKRRFNKKITQTENKMGHHSIVINEKIFEQGNEKEFLDTVRHEVAHAFAYAKYDEYPSRKKNPNYNPYLKPHGQAWKDIASKFGADPSSCASKRSREQEYDYYAYCTSCGKKYGRTKRSKCIKRPFERRCTQCDSDEPLSSYDSGQDPPTESGVVKVESIPWDDRQIYHKSART